MADANLSLLGVVNGATDGSFDQNNKLFRDQFAGEVLTAFDETNVFEDKHLTRTITEGKSASFPATWKFNARYHTPGTPVLGSNQMKVAERTILIDDLLLADVVIGDLEEAKNHYDVRSIYSKQLGAALAREYDKRVAQVLVNTAREAATVQGAFGGSTLRAANAKTDAEVLTGMVFSANQVFDEKDVPVGERFVAVLPAQYYLLAQSTKLLNRDWGGAGVYSQAELPLVGGMTLVKSNNIPHTVVAAASGDRNTSYAGDFTKTVAICWRKEAAGTVKLMDLAVQQSGQDFAIMYQGTLMVAKYAMGHGILRPECAIELALPAA